MTGKKVRKRKKPNKQRRKDTAQAAPSIPVWKMDEKSLRKHRLKTEGLKGLLPSGDAYFDEGDRRAEEKVEIKRFRQEEKRKRRIRRREEREKFTFADFRDRFFTLRAKILIPVILAAAIFLITVVWYLWKTYTITTIYVEGNRHYTDEEITKMVMGDNQWSGNSIYLRLKYRHMKTDDIPFVSAMEVDIMAPDTIKITVYEKSLAGYVSYMGRYMYFDKDGTVVESSQTAVSDVPEVTGLQFDHVVIYESLPVEKTEVFEKILNTTQALDKYELDADQISFDPSYAITLIFGDVRVQIGQGENIDDKLSRLRVILPELAGEKGVLQMSDYKTGTKNVTFKKDN